MRVRLFVCVNNDCAASRLKIEFFLSCLNVVSGLDDQGREDPDGARRGSPASVLSVFPALSGRPCTRRVRLVGFAEAIRPDP